MIPTQRVLHPKAGDPYGADSRNRTDISYLEGRSNNHYTISAYVGGTNLLRFCTSTIKVLLSQRQESNLRPTDYKSVALPAELLGH